MSYNFCKSNWFLERQGICQSICLFQGRNKIGRRSENNIIISDSTYISRDHCEINVISDLTCISGERCQLIDYSSNGTYVNDIQILNDTKNVCENDKIGIGVFDIDEEKLTDTIYHVYILRKVKNTNNNNANEPNSTNPVIMCPSIITIDDSDSEESIKNNLIEITNKYDEKITKSKNSFQNLKNIEEIGDREKSVTIISDVVISRPPDCRVQKLDITTKQNQLQIVNKCETIKTKAESDFNVDVPSSSEKQKCRSTCNFINDEEKEILTIDIVSDDEINSNSTEVRNPIVWEISDDEEFQCSQYLMQDIKQEINDFDFEDAINNKNSPKQNDDDKHEKLSSPVYDLLNDDNDGEDAEEFDENLANWYLKLSQAIVVKHEINNDEVIYNENLDNEMQLNSTTCDIPKLLPNVELDRFIENLPEKMITDLHIAKQDKEDCVKVTHYVEHKQYENKYNHKTEKSKIPQLIDAPRLPIHKGKLRGVSADKKSNLTAKKKLAIIKTDRKLNGETFLRNANVSKEKDEIKKIHDDRKQKLKLIADKETEKRTVIEPNDSRALKKPKVKITKKNRGAFLTELTSDASKSVTSKRKNSEIQDKLKLIKIPKISPATSLTTSDIITNCQPKQEQVDKSLHNLQLHKNYRSTEKKPEKLSFKSLTFQEDVVKRREKIQLNSPTVDGDKISKIQILTNPVFIKSILLTKSKSKQQGIVKKVRFNEAPHIIYYDREMTDEAIKTPRKFIQKDLTFDLSLLSERKKLRLRTFSFNDHTDAILSELLLWNAEWLENDFEQVNGPNHLLMPMIHQFQSLREYENTIFPLLKLEMWVQLRKSYQIANENYIRCTLNGFRIDDRNVNKRIIYNCQYSENKNQAQKLIFTGDFVLIQINSYKIFGYVRENSFIYNTNKSNYTITIETQLHEKLLSILRIIKNVNLKKLSSITIELGQFNAVSQMKYSPLLQDILNPVNLTKSNLVSIDNIKYQGYHKLNDIQKDILLRTYIKCINPREPNITLIEGPPGTGKSRLVSNLVLQILYGREVRKLDRRILICAPSNAAIDVITLQLIHIRKKMTNLQARFNLVRFGVVERMHPDAQMYSLTGLIAYNRKTEKINISGLESEKKFIEDKIRTLQQNNNQNTVDQNELYKLKENLNRINSLINPKYKNLDCNKILYSKFLAGAHIICSTLPSCVKLLKYMKFFDVCIIDEATQCTEPWSIIPFQFTINSLVLVGDKQQLPATVVSKLSKEYNYGKSLFTRISECVENSTVNNPILTLRTQYRMHPEICRWPNLYFYKNRLINDITVEQMKLKLKPYSIFNLEYKQNKTKECSNISNTLEATFVTELIKHLKYFMPFEEYKYGIISPYAQHRDILQKQLKDSNILNIVASTIDSYQGNEKDVIIISNGRTEGVGFLCDVSRLNHLPAWKSLLSDAKSRNIYYDLTSKEIANFKDNVMKKIVI